MKTNHENNGTATPGQSPDANPFLLIQAHARPRFTQPVPLSRRAARLSRFFPLSSR